MDVTRRELFKRSGFGAATLAGGSLWPAPMTTQSLNSRACIAPPSGPLTPQRAHPDHIATESVARLPGEVGLRRSPCWRIIRFGPVAPMFAAAARRVSCRRSGYRR